MADLITIDLALYSTPEGKRELTHTLITTVRERDVFYVKNFNISQECVNSQDAIGRDYYDLPLEYPFPRTKLLHTEVLDPLRVMPVIALELPEDYFINLHKYEVKSEDHPSLHGVQQIHPKSSPESVNSSSVAMPTSGAGLPCSISQSIKGYPSSEWK